MKSMHNRKFVPGGIDLVMCRVKNDLKSMPQDEIERLMIENNFLLGAPFLWVGLLYRYGIKNDLKPEFNRINKKYGDLPIALELKAEILEWADRNNLDLLEDIFMVASLEALIQVGQKYKLSIDVFIEERSHYLDIPNSVEDCKTLKRLKKE